MTTSTETTRRAPSMSPDDRRAAIVAATMPLLVEYGDSITTRQIAHAAGIAEGTIFRVFADKDEVLAATLDAALDTRAMEAALNAIDASLPLRDRLVAATTILERRVVDLSQLVSSVAPAIRERAVRPHEDSPALARLFEPDRDAISIDPMQAGRLLRAVALSIAHPVFGVESMTPDEIVTFFLHGIGATA